MPNLFGHYYSQEELLRRVAHLSQVGGVQTLSLNDGTRVLEFRTGSGFSFRITADTGLDCCFAEYQGIPLSAPGQFCQSYGISPSRSSRVLRYGERWEDGDDCVLELEGRVDGEQLSQARCFSAWLGESRVFLQDTITNVSSESVADDWAFHLTVGFPFVDEGSLFIAPLLTSNGQAPFASPQKDRPTEEAALGLRADALGDVPLAVVNPRLGGEGRAVYLIYNRRQTPHIIQRLRLGEGQYTVSMQLNADPGVLLAPGERHIYDLEIGVLENAEAIQVFRDRVEALRTGV